MNKMYSICENCGWSVTDNEDGTVTVAQASPAGEDFSFDVSKNNFVEDIVRYADDFDKDEHIEMWIGARRAGVSGVPSTRELVKDAEAIKTMLADLADALVPRATIREQVAACSEAFILVECYGLIGFFSNTRVSEVNLPDGLYAYEFRGDGENNDFCTLEKKVGVDFTGTFVTDVEIEFGPDGYISLTEDEQPNFALDYEIEDDIENLAEWFSHNPNNNWSTPLSIEVEGNFSTAEALALTADIKAYAEKLVKDRGFVRSYTPMENIGTVRWSLGDIISKASDMDDVGELNRESLIRIVQILEPSIGDFLVEMGWDSVESAIRSAAEPVSPFDN